MDIPSELGIDHMYQPGLPSGRLNSFRRAFEIVGDFTVIKGAISPGLLLLLTGDDYVLCVSSNLKIDVRSDQ
jgi:hypothetical protein